MYFFSLLLWFLVHTSITFKEAQMATIEGSSISETLLGTESEDLIFGFDGDDTIYGYGENDILSGDSGNDIIYSGSGSDRVYGNSGNDLLEGSSGDDYLNGDSGNDTLTGGTGADAIQGGEGNDIFKYDSVSDSTPTSRDTIDFSPGFDKIDLSAIDANIISSKKQPFYFIGSASFGFARTDSGLVRYDAENNLIQAAIVKSGAFETVLEIKSSVDFDSLSESDFIL